MSNKSRILFSILTIFLGFSIMVESVFLFNETPLYAPILAIIASFFVSMLCIYAINKRKESLFKITLITLFFAAIGLALYVGLMKTGILELLDDSDSLTDLMKKTGIWGPIIYILIQFLQVTFIPIPSTITTVAGMVAFQSLPLVLICSTIGMIAGSMFAFFLGRVFGVKLVVWMVGSKSFNKYQKILKGRDKMMLFLMFLLPIFPDDLLCLFAGVTSMSYGTFFIMQIITRPIGITVTSLSVDVVSMIPLNTWWGILIWVIAGILLVVMMVCVWKYSGKLENAMVSFITKKFGTNEMSATIDKLDVKNEVQNLISDTIVDSDTDSNVSVVNTKTRYKQKRYFVNYRD